MKYIRTKDRIVKCEDETLIKDDKVPRLTFKPYKQGKIILPEPIIEYDEIIKQTDTIEELCDAFVVDDRTSKHNKPWVSRERFNLEARKDIGKHLDVCVGKGAIYGAIWTDKGLIYVAKLNGKGELELI